MVSDGAIQGALTALFVVGLISVDTGTEFQLAYLWLFAVLPLVGYGMDVWFQQ